VKYEKRFLTLGVLASLVVATGCNEAQTVSANISKAADNFEVARRVVFINGITNDYLLSIEGLCSIEADQSDKQLEVTCKVGEKDGEGEFLKHYLGLSDNTTYMAEQLAGIDVSAYHYRVDFKPQAILPDVHLRWSAKELKTNRKGEIQESQKIEYQATAPEPVTGEVPPTPMTPEK
jgi:hypothetical protein